MGSPSWRALGRSSTSSSRDQSTAPAAPGVLFTPLIAGAPAGMAKPRERRNCQRKSPAGLPDSASGGPDKGAFNVSYRLGKTGAGAACRSPVPGGIRRRGAFARALLPVSSSAGGMPAKSEHPRTCQCIKRRTLAPKPRLSAQPGEVLEDLKLKCARPVSSLRLPREHSRQLDFRRRSSWNRRRRRWRLRPAWRARPPAWRGT